ncbi:MAG TPA: signal peptidase I [Candidatus Acidoferrales bacterium]|jgi:signal peptidase I|nr:signal peptidase I [Candidatus Acidoferrales bacterium]
MNRKSKKYRIIALRWWRKEIRPLLILCAILFSIRSSLADWNDVPTGSMKPTILEGDRVFVNKLAYDLKVPFTTWHIAQWADPQRGDIVVFYSPKDGTRLVKRVIGLPGDTVELRNDQLILNGQPVDYAAAAATIPERLSGLEHDHGVFATEKLADHAHAVMGINGVQAMRSFAPVQVAAGHYFMMGDNRDNSFDSRYFGTVARDQIVGRTASVVVSLDKENYWMPRWGRTFSALDGNGK